MRVCVLSGVLFSSDRTDYRGLCVNSRFPDAHSASLCCSKPICVFFSAPTPTSAGIKIPPIIVNAQRVCVPPETDAQLLEVASLIRIKAPETPCVMATVLVSRDGVEKIIWDYGSELILKNPEKAAFARKIRDGLGMLAAFALPKSFQIVISTCALTRDESAAFVPASKAWGGTVKPGISLYAVFGDWGSKMANIENFINTLIKASGAAVAVKPTFVLAGNFGFPPFTAPDTVGRSVGWLMALKL